MDDRKRIVKQVKDTWFFSLCFVPFLQWIPFFIINGRVPRKRWLIMGFANILFLVAAIFLYCMGDIYRDNYRPSRPGGAPQVRDYLGECYWNIEDYDKTPEYMQYEKDYNDWIESPEYQAYEEENGIIVRRSDTISRIGTAMICIVWFGFFLLGFWVERYKYLRVLEDKRNRSSVYSQLDRRADLGDSKEKITSNSVKEDAGINALTVHEGININTADENELMQLPGMKTIDAKKILDYRLKNGSFKSVDEFFEAFDAKPHILVKMEKLIYIEEKEAFLANSKTVANEQNNSKRRFDF